MLKVNWKSNIIGDPNPQLTSYLFAPWASCSFNFPLRSLQISVRAFCSCWSWSTYGALWKIHHKPAWSCQPSAFQRHQTLPFPSSRWLLVRHCPIFLRLPLFPFVSSAWIEKTWVPSFDPPSFIFRHFFARQAACFFCFGSEASSCGVFDLVCPWFLQRFWRFDLRIS